MVKDIKLFTARKDTRSPKQEQMLALFRDMSSCCSRISRLDPTSYVVVHQFILCLLQVPMCPSVSMS